jgi:putative ABC transport system permease protein
MLIGETVRVALQSIRDHKLRAMLTMLGIIIGVGAVIAVVALGTGAQRAVEARIQALGANLLTIYPGQSFMGGRASDVRVSLTTDDYKALEADAQLIDAVVPELQRSLQVKYGNLNFNINILGTTPNYVPVRNYTVMHGRMYTQGDDESRQRYAVVGSAIPTMFNVNAAGLVNQTILIRGQPFEVIGVLSEKGSQGSFENPDERVMIPLSTARFRLFGTDRLRSIAVRVREGTPLEQGMVDIERVLRREHKVRPGGDNDFQIRNQQEILTTQQQTTETFKMLLGSIAAVSLLVGGIGIMNIMLVSVTERTREIGIRKALGATKINVLLQFLIEALVLCLIGGALGVLAGAGGASAMSKFLGWNTFISPSAVGVAFAFSAVVGIFFGLWPARRAAMLNTIEALRYE